MTLKVIGTSLSRSGTMSTRMALEHLGIGQYNHMMSLFADPTQVAIWTDLARVNAMQLVKSGRRLRGPQNLPCPRSRPPCKPQRTTASRPY